MRGYGYLHLQAEAFTRASYDTYPAEVAAGIDLMGKRAVVTGAAPSIGIERLLALAGAEDTFAVWRGKAAQAVEALGESGLAPCRPWPGPSDCHQGRSLGASVKHLVRTLSVSAATAGPWRPRRAGDCPCGRSDLSHEERVSSLGGKGFLKRAQ